MNVSGSGGSENLALSYGWRALTTQPDERVEKQLTTATEWAKQRCRIRQLYLVDGLTRDQTRLIMKHRYGFDASDVQYKYQIKKWSFQKSLTHQDKKWMAEVRHFCQKEHNLVPIFLLCGIPIPKAKVARQIRGKSVSEVAEVSPLSGNLIWHYPFHVPFDRAVRESRSVSTTKLSNLETLYICCVTCLECELDLYTSIDERFWFEPFERHLVRKHAKLSHRFALTWCMSDPSLSNAPDHQIAHEWNYALEDMSEDEHYPKFYEHYPKFYDHYPSIKQMLLLLGPTSHTSVIQEEPQSKSLWLVDISDDTKMKSLALITRRPDKTPRDLIQSLLTEISSHDNNNQPHLPSAAPPAMETEMGSVNPGPHISGPAGPSLREAWVQRPTNISSMSLDSLDRPPIQLW